MEIKCTPQELKELLKKETPVAETTDVSFELEMYKNYYKKPEFKI